MLVNPIPHKSYKFTILNLRKASNLYSQGWAPIYFSVNKNRWFKAKSCTYGKSN